MKARLSNWVQANRIILANAGSLVSSQLITSVLGFVYWWVAARQFPTAAVGLASAVISAMMLLSTASLLGLGTLLIGELPGQPDRALSLIATAAVAAGTVGAAVGFLFAIMAPSWSTDLRPLGANLESMMLFAFGVGLTTLTLLLDQAVIGLLRGALQLGRNILFAVTKLIVLVVVGLETARLGLLIYATWVVGSLVSLVSVLRILQQQQRYGNGYRPEWSLLRKLGRTALGHHALNLTLQIPGLALPIVVTVELSAITNAHFYVAWMVVNLLFVAPYALTTVLYAVGVADSTSLAHKVRQTLGLACTVGVLANIAFWLGGPLVLGFFGPSYLEASTSLHILALAVFPLIVRHHYVALSRIWRRLSNATLLQAGGSFLELSLATIGGAMGGLEGLSIGWVLALTVEAVCMVAPVYETAIKGYWLGADKRVKRNHFSKPIEGIDEDGLQADPAQTAIPEGVLEGRC